MGLVAMAAIVVDTIVVAVDNSNTSSRCEGETAISNQHGPLTD